MKQMLMRPTAALFPIAGIAGVLIGNHSCTMEVFVSYYLIQLFSLCAADCFRNAAAQEPGVRRVDERFSGSFLPLIFGIIVTWVLWAFALAPQWRMGAWQGACVAAALVSIEHLFEERMYALGRRIDGVILSCIANGLLAVGLMLGSGGSSQLQMSNTYAILGAGLGAAISILSSYIIEKGHGFSLKPQNLRFAACAAPMTLLYIVAAVIATTITRARILDMMLPLLFGLIPWRLARTNCRRTQDESRFLNLLLIAFAAIPTTISTIYPMAQSFALTAYIALICSAIVFCTPTDRCFAGIALTAIAFMVPPVISILLSLAAILINAHKAFLKKV